MCPSGHLWWAPHNTWVVSWRFCPLKVLPCVRDYGSYTHSSSLQASSSPRVLRYNLNHLTSSTKAVLVVAQPFTSSPTSKPAGIPPTSVQQALPAHQWRQVTPSSNIQCRWVQILQGTLWKRNFVIKEILRLLHTCPLLGETQCN